MQQVTQDSLQDVIAMADVVVINFSASWCAPCQDFYQVLTAAEQKNSDIVFATVDIEKEPALAEEFGVRSVPFLMVIRDRVVVFAEAGAHSGASLQDLLNQAKALSEDELPENDKNN